MNSKNDKSGLRIGLSAAAMILFLCYIVVKCFVLKDTDDYAYYGWKMSVLYYMVRFIPYIALFAFAVCERKVKSVNPRIFLVALFGILLLQMIVAGGSNNGCMFAYIYDMLDYIIGESYFPWFMGLLRLFTLLAVGCLSNRIIKWTSRIMIAIYAIPVAIIVIFDSLMMERFISNYFEVAIEIVFYLALYYFNELCTEDNDLGWFDGVFDFILTRVFKVDYEDDMEDDEDDLDDCFEDVDYDNYSNMGQIREAYEEYQKVLIHALYTKNEEMLKAASVIERLSHKNFLDENNEFYTEDFVYSQYKVLEKYVRDLNEKHAGFISPVLKILIERALKTKGEDGFFVEAVNAAVILCKKADMEWLMAGALVRTAERGELN